MSACAHERLRFAPGALFITCVACGARWARVTEGQRQDPEIRGTEERIPPEKARGI